MLYRSFPSDYILDGRTSEQDDIDQEQQNYIQEAANELYQAHS